MLFETEFHEEISPEEIYALSSAEREIADNDYIKAVYFGVCEKREELDEIITKHSNGWKAGRITPVSRSAMRLCLYEMKYMPDIPKPVSINEAVELVKTFDDLKMKSFVNGVLNGAKGELEAENA